MSTFSSFLLDTCSRRRRRDFQLRQTIGNLQFFVLLGAIFTIFSIRIIINDGLAATFSIVIVVAIFLVVRVHGIVPRRDALRIDKASGQIRVRGTVRSRIQVATKDDWLVIGLLELFGSEENVVRLAQLFEYFNRTRQFEYSTNGFGTNVNKKNCAVLLTLTYS